MLKLILGSNDSKTTTTTTTKAFTTFNSPNTYRHSQHDLDFAEGIWILLSCIFAFVGDIVIWAAAAFKRSKLPELIVIWSVWMFQVFSHIISSLQLHERSIAFGQYLVAQILALDRQTMLSQKVSVALLSIIQSILSSVEVKPVYNSDRPKQH